MSDIYADGRDNKAQLHIGLILPDVLGTEMTAMRWCYASALAARDYRGDRPDQVGRSGAGEPRHLHRGGGEDTAQILAAEHLAKDGGIVRAANAGRLVLAICAGLQVFGQSFRASDRMVDGLGLLDATTSSWKSA